MKSLLRLSARLLSQEENFRYKRYSVLYGRLLKIQRKKREESMGLRFRKSFKIAPGVKVNLNKKSSSVTFGGKGAHYTVNSKGRKTTTVGIPGTGMSYTSTTSSQKAKKSKGNKDYGKYASDNHINYDFADILSEKEFEMYIKYTKDGFIFDASPSAIVTPSGRETKIASYKIAHAISLILSIVILLFALIGLVVSIPTGIVFLVVAAIIYFPFRSYGRMVKIHRKIFANRA